MGWGYGNGFGFGGFGFHFHMLFGLVLLLGVIFLLMLAHKHFKKEQLKKWAAWMLVVGALGVLLTSAWGFAGKYGFGKNLGYNMMWGDEEFQKDMWELMEKRFGEQK